MPRRLPYLFLLRQRRTWEVAEEEEEEEEVVEEEEEVSAAAISLPVLLPQPQDHQEQQARQE